MRILSLGVPMPGPQVDNHTFANAPAFFDYDALVADPAALSRLIEDVVAGAGEHKTRSDERVLNGATEPDTIDLADLLRERQAQTARLLARGGLVVCIARPNVVHHRVAGFSGCDRYFWLPAPPGLQYREPFLRRGEGTQVVLIEHDHPFCGYLERFRGKLAYHAYFADDAPGFAGAGRVVARSVGGAAVAVELALGHGRAVFLPPLARPPTGDARYASSNALQESIRQALRLAAASSPPPWLREYDLPGLPERIADRERAQEQLADAREQLAASEAALDELERYRRLLWQEGRYGLEEPVRAALAFLGFQVAPDDLDAPAELRLDGETALLEVDASAEAVGMDGHHRLRRRLEEAIAQAKPAAPGKPRGVLIINGYRTQPPAQRPQQYHDALRIAAESMRYCLATSEQLFHAVRAALTGDEATVRAFRQRLLTTEGVLRED